MATGFFFFVGRSAFDILYQVLFFFVDQFGILFFVEDSNLFHFFFFMSVLFSALDSGLFLASVFGSVLFLTRDSRSRFFQLFDPKVPVLTYGGFFFLLLFFRC
ncbi:hypothetical protein RhiirA5_374190 [Rhizophagus irregularis]|uniref:Uncharacterized protein n=1 Tax=Rhizophagus irregularis TaxID=588596 RepID=A0A2N0PW34_9GLOM|nr:hypothetical protein RhiirA5_374190 [Rhizophagus irregularis]